MLYDSDIREPLYLYLEGLLGKIRILEEKNMGCSRADAVMVMQRALCGLEIKSDADSYQRLSTQVRDYDQYFDYNCIVAGRSHREHVAEHVPPSWGIIVVSGEKEHVSFEIQRPMLLNPGRDMKKKMSILWRPELQQLLAVNHLPAYREKSKVYVAAVLLDRVPHHILQQQISDTLFERDYTLIAAQLDAYRKDHGKRPAVRVRRRVRRRRRRA